MSEDVFLYMTASICVLHVVQSEVEEEVTVSMSDVYGADYIAYDVIGGTGEDMKDRMSFECLCKKASHVWGR